MSLQRFIYSSLGCCSFTLITFRQLIVGGVITGGSTFQKKIINGWGVDEWK